MICASVNRDFLIQSSLRPLRLKDCHPKSGPPGGAIRPPWQDLVLRGNVRAYLQPGRSASQTVVTGLRFDLRGNLDQPCQATLGGEASVRSYREDEVLTGGALVAFADHRVNLAWPHPVMDLGVSVFGHAGRGWAGDVPLGVETGWRTAARGGLRLGVPAGTRSVTRIELAWPVGGPLSGRGPVLRTYWAPARTSR